jgi:hypothetical protein
VDIMRPFRVMGESHFIYSFGAIRNDPCFYIRSLSISLDGIRLRRGCESTSSLLDRVLSIAGVEGYLDTISPCI